MILNLLSTVGNDKYVEHPVLGTISCSGLYQGYKRCNEFLNTTGALPIQCRSLHDMSIQCYKKKSTEEVRQWLDDQVDEKRRLYKFLKEEKSLLPELESKHAIFDINELEASDPKAKINPKVDEYVQNEARNNRKFF